jgi:hypothetical protein
MAELEKKISEAELQVAFHSCCRTVSRTVICSSFGQPVETDLLCLYRKARMSYVKPISQRPNSCTTQALSELTDSRMP